MAPPTLTTLPYDVKAEILKELLCRSELISIGTKYGDEIDEERLSTGSELYPAILLTCKSLYEDGVYLLYHLNSFSLDVAVEGLHRWTTTIGEKNFAEIVSLKICLNLGTFWKHWKWKHVDLVEKEAGRAKSMEPYVRVFSLMALPSSNIRHLGIRLYGMRDPDDNSAIHQIEIVRKIGSISTLQSLELFGSLSQVWLQYLNRKLRVPITLERNWACNWDLKGAILRLKEEMEKTKELIALDESTIAALTELDEPTFEGSGLVQDNSMQRFESTRYCMPEQLFDEPKYYENSGGSNTTTVTSAFSGSFGVRIFEEELRIHTEPFATTTDFYLKQLKVDAKKLRFLIGFWEELEGLGILKKEDGAAVSGEGA